MDPTWAVGLENTESLLEGLHGLTWEGFWEAAFCSWGWSRDLTGAGLEWAGKGATIPSMDNVCLSWALLKV